MNPSLTDLFPIALLAVLLVGADCVANADDKLFDQWTYLPAQSTAVQHGGEYGQFVPVGYAESKEYFTAAMVSNSKLGHIKALQMRCWGLDRVGPAIDWTQRHNLGLDYAFADAECGGIQADIKKVQSYIDKIRTSTDPSVKRAKVGNWSWFDGMYTDTWWFYQPWPVWPEHAQAESFTRTNLQVSQPSLYPYSYNIKHTTAGDTLNGVTYKYVGGSSPTQRSAQFWAPLEILSSAKRRLPQGQELIPYISDYLHVNGFEPQTNQMLTDADYTASIVHYRLRGADGLYTWSETNSARYLQYRSLVASAWKSLNGFFARPGSLRSLNNADNFGTHKSLGIEWSAVQKGSRVMGIVSNLNSVSNSMRWDATAAPTGMPKNTASILSLPPRSPTVAAYTHVTLQYRTPYLEYDTFERFAIGQSMDRSGWHGSNTSASGWYVAAPLGAGNSSRRVVAPESSGTGAPTSVWFGMVNQPEFAVDDKVSYSAMIYFDNAALSVSLLNSSGVVDSKVVAPERRGPELSIAETGNQWSFYFGKRASETPNYVAVGKQPIAHHWYECLIDVDPKAARNGVARVSMRDVTSGDREFVVLVWDDLLTTTADRQLELPLSLNPTSNPTNLDAWQLTASQGTQFDNFNVGYAVPTADDNFEHYEVANALDSQGWRGASAEQWEVRAPLNSSGNRSSLAATPKSNAQNVSAWWKTMSPDFESGDFVVYSAMLYGANQGFSPVTTVGADRNSIISESGPYFSMSTDSNAGFRFRGMVDSGDRYKATVLPIPNHWYEIQIVVDPLRMIAGSPAGRKGVAKIFVRDCTTGGEFEQLRFTNESNDSSNRLAELPLWLKKTNNPIEWDGWQVFGADSGSQIDELRTFLYPFKDFALGGAVNANMVGPNP